MLKQMMKVIALTEFGRVIWIKEQMFKCHQELIMICY